MAGAGTVRQEIEQRNREFVAAFNRGDAAGVAAMYVEDARVLPPGGAMASGRQAIQQFWQSVMGMGVREVDLRTQEVESSGDLAYEIGAATLAIQPESGSPTTDTVKYVVVWKRRAGGAWQLAVDIWNANTQA
jgi:uncharacterized protein (TIGR02246 family)